MVKIKILWGSSWYHKHQIDEIKESIAEYEFDTQAEADAFIRGAREMEGWDDFYKDEKISELLSELAEEQDGVAVSQ